MKETNLLEKRFGSGRLRLELVELNIEIIQKSNVTPLEVATLSADTMIEQSKRSNESGIGRMVFVVTSEINNSV